MLVRQNPINYAWEQLANAVVVWAVHDWCGGAIAERDLKTAKLEKLRHKQDAEAFLKSEWCEFIGGLNGDYILEKLKKSDIDNLFLTTRMDYIVPIDKEEV